MKIMGRSGNTPIQVKMHSKSYSLCSKMVQLLRFVVHSFKAVLFVVDTNKHLNHLYKNLISKTGQILN